ncbi:MAG: hypothetical protein V1870_02615 [Candidatus Aenigmatarchaeota archaeon]
MKSLGVIACVTLVVVVLLLSLNLGIVKADLPPRVDKCIDKMTIGWRCDPSGVCAFTDRCKYRERCHMDSDKPVCKPCEDNGGGLIVIGFAGVEGSTYYNIKKSVQNSGGKISKCKKTPVDFSLIFAEGLLKCPVTDRKSKYVDDICKEFEAAESDDVVIFIVKAHGNPTGSLTADKKGNIIKPEDVLGCIQKSKAKYVVIVIDSCFSGIWVNYFKTNNIKSVSVVSSADAINPCGWADASVFGDTGVEGESSLMSEAFADILADRMRRGQYIDINKIFQETLLRHQLAGCPGCQYTTSELMDLLVYNPDNYILDDFCKD